jgi:Na+/melibiose symporter-like transporter
MSTTTAFGVLWGGPYLVQGVGMTTPQAGAVLMAGVVFAAVLTPALGAFLGARRVFRVGIAWTYSLLTVIALAVLVGLGDHPPLPYVVVFFVVVTIGAPLSMAAFAVTRDYNEAETLGTASGVVNVGGFAATILIVLGIGWVLDRMGGVTPHNLRMALLVAIAVQGWGVFRLGVWALRGRAEAFNRMALGETPPVVFVRHRWDLAPPAAALDQQVTPW